MVMCGIRREGGWNLQLQTLQSTYYTCMVNGRGGSGCSCGHCGVPGEERRLAAVNTVECVVHMYGYVEMEVWKRDAGHYSIRKSVV